MGNSYSFLVPTKDIQDAVNHLHKLLKKIKPKPTYPILDVIVKLDTVELRLVGMSRFIKVDHKNAYSFTIPFIDLYASVIGSNEEAFTATISEGLIKIANREISSAHIKLVHPENVQRFGLAMNSSILEILALRHKFTYELLEEKDYLKIVESAEEKLEDEIHKALCHLYQYGITYKFLKERIDKIIQDTAQKE